MSIMDNGNHISPITHIHINTMVTIASTTISIAFGVPCPAVHAPNTENIISIEKVCMAVPESAGTRGHFQCM